MAIADANINVAFLQDADKKLRDVLRKELAETKKELDAFNRNQEQTIRVVSNTVQKDSRNIFQKFAATVDGADSKLKKFGITSQDLAVIMGAGLAGGVAFAIRSLIQFVAAATQAAASLEEMQNKTTVVFGDASADVLKFGENAASALGLSNRAALEAASTFGNLFTSMGITQHGAADLSISLTTLASDLASFNDIDTEQALTALRSGLIGETEPLRRLGVNLNAATISQEGFSLGLVKGKQNLNAAGKALAAYSIIIQQTSAAQGDFNATQDSLANTTRALAAEYEDLQANLGQKTLPLIIKATRLFADLANEISFLVDDPVNALNEEAITLNKRLLDLGKIIVGVDEANKKADKRFLEAIEFARKYGISVSQAREELDLLQAEQERETDAAKRSKQDAEAIRILAEEAGLTDKEIKKLTERILAQAEAARLSGQTNFDVAKSFAELTDGTEEAKRAAEQLADAHRRLDKAIKDSEVRINEAEITLARAYGDSELKVDAAEKKLADSIRDRARTLADGRRAVAKAIRDQGEAVADAEEKVADAIKNRAKIQRNAREAVDEARLRGDREVRDAREKLGDAIRDHNRAEQDAEEKLLELRERRTKAIQDAQRAIAAAQSVGNAAAENEARIAQAQGRDSEETARAQRNLARERKDRLREIARLERDLKEAREDAAKDIAEAQRDLQEAIEETNDAVTDAQRDLERTIRDSDEAVKESKRQLARDIKDNNREVLESELDLRTAHREASEAILDAQRALDEAHRQATENIRDARIGFRRLNRASRELARNTREAAENMERIAMVSQGGLIGEDIVGLSGQQHGGDVWPGRPYWVGEKEPEIFWPKEAGHIYNLAQLATIMKGRGMDGATFQNYIYEAVSAEATAEAVMARVMRGIQ